MKQRLFDLSKGRRPLRERPAQHAEHANADVIAWLRRLDQFAPWSVPEIIAGLVLIAAFLASL